MFDAQFAADPYPVYERLRTAGPIHWRPDFLKGAWLLPRHGDVLEALRDPRLSARRSHVFIDQFPADVRDQLGEFKRIHALWLLFLDPPQHGRLRKLMNQGFRPSLLQRMRPRIERIVHELLDRVVERRHMEFMGEFAHPLPALVIADMLGVDGRDQPKFVQWSDDIAAFQGSPRSTLQVAFRAQESLVAIREYFERLLPARRRDPGDDLISLLLGVKDDGDALTTDEVLAQCSMLLFGGHETTSHLLGNGLHALFRHPDQMAYLRAHPAGMSDAIRELLRFDSPVQYTTRIAGQDLELHGHVIERGQVVVPLIGAANRDPERFVNPGRLDVTRKQPMPPSFGHGPHACIGATISLLEAEVAFSAILERLPDLTLVGNASPPRTSSALFRGFRTLDVRW